MTSHSSRLPLHMGLGWYIHRSSDAAKAADYYGRVLHLPLLRGYGNAYLFWAGEARVFEPKSDAAPDLRWPDPTSVPTLPVFRTGDAEGLSERLKLYGADIVGDLKTELGHSVIVRDPQSHLVGFRQSGADSKLPHDIAAKERAEKNAPPTSFNPGCAPMPNDIQSLDWIVRRVSDLDAFTAFYSNVVGFSVIEQSDTHALLDMGDNSTLELRPGGQRQQPPGDRFEVPGAFIIRVSDFDAYAAHLESHSVQSVNDRIQFGRGALAYFADPDGQIIGYEERYDQENCNDGAIAFPEDLEANRRWRAQKL